MAPIITLFSLLLVGAIATAPLRHPSLTNDTPYCAKQRAEGIPACKAFKDRVLQMSCEVTHQAICIDRDVPFKLMCDQVARNKCFGSATPEVYRACVTETVSSCPPGLMPAEHKCASDGFGHYKLCLPGVNIFEPCTQYLARVCPPAYKMYTLGTVRACSQSCAKFHGVLRLTLEACVADCLRKYVSNLS